MKPKSLTKLQNDVLCNAFSSEFPHDVQLDGVVYYHTRVELEVLLKAVNKVAKYLEREIPRLHDEEQASQHAKTPRLICLDCVREHAAGTRKDKEKLPSCTSHY